jgi:hypothetical protein
LSSDEMKSFMKDNAPSPPRQMQNANSAYGTDQKNDSISILQDMLKNKSTKEQSNSTGKTSSSSSYLSQLLESLKNGGSNSLINVTA